MWKKIVVCCFVNLLGKALVLLFYFGREGAGWQGLLCSMKFIALLALSIAKMFLLGFCPAKEHIGTFLVKFGPFHSNCSLC